MRAHERSTAAARAGALTALVIITGALSMIRPPEPARAADGEERPAKARDAETGFEPIFDGKTLDGWRAPDMRFWRVEDGAITGEVTADRKPPENVFLVWQGGKVADFELRFRFRISAGASNSGMQFRSEVKERGLVHGYQADISGDGRWTGGIFDEYGPRGSLAARGERSRFDAAGDKTVTKLLPDGGDPLAGDKTPAPGQWHDYHLRAEGEHVVLTINGVVTAELFDGDRARQRLSGVLAVPVIPAEMKVQYKDLRLKRLGESR